MSGTSERNRATRVASSLRRRAIPAVAATLLSLAAWADDGGAADLGIVTEVLPSAPDPSGRPSRARSVDTVTGAVTPLDLPAGDVVPQPFTADTVLVATSDAASSRVRVLDRDLRERTATTIPTDVDFGRSFLSPDGRLLLARRRSGDQVAVWTLDGERLFGTVHLGSMREPEGGWMRGNRVVLPYANRRGFLVGPPGGAGTDFATLGLPPGIDGSIGDFDASPIDGRIAFVLRERDGRGGAVDSIRVVDVAAGTLRTLVRTPAYPRPAGEGVASPDPRRIGNVFWHHAGRGLFALVGPRLHFTESADAADLTIDGANPANTSAGIVAVPRRPDDAGEASWPGRADFFSLARGAGGERAAPETTPGATPETTPDAALDASPSTGPAAAPPIAADLAATVPAGLRAESIATLAGDVAFGTGPWRAMEPGSEAAAVRAALETLPASARHPENPEITIRDEGRASGDMRLAPADGKARGIIVAACEVRDGRSRLLSVSGSPLGIVAADHSVRFDAACDLDRAERGAAGVAVRPALPPPSSASAAPITPSIDPGAVVRAVMLGDIRKFSTLMMLADGSAVLRRPNGGVSTVRWAERGGRLHVDDGSGWSPLGNASELGAGDPDMRLSGEYRFASSWSLFGVGGGATFASYFFTPDGRFAVSSSSITGGTSAAASTRCDVTGEYAAASASGPGVTMGSSRQGSGCGPANRGAYRIDGHVIELRTDAGETLHLPFFVRGLETVLIGRRWYWNDPER